MEMSLLKRLRACDGMPQVAFSAFTDFGAVMALAIAVHNIPEVAPLLALSALSAVSLILAVLQLAHHRALLAGPLCGTSVRVMYLGGAQMQSCCAGSHCGSACVRSHWEQMEGHGNRCGFGMAALQPHHPFSQ